LKVTTEGNYLVISGGALFIFIYSLQHYFKPIPGWKVVSMPFDKNFTIAYGKVTFKRLNL